MKKYSGLREFWAENWLIILIAAQPLLDILAFWMQNSVATAAGYIRLIIMVALPLYLLFTLKKKKGLIISMGVMGLYALLHVLNCFRLGYISISYDLAYMARVMQLPVMAISLIYLMKDEKTKKQALKGIMCAAVIFISAVILSLLTGTWTSTYGAGVGLSGWVIEDNRCANSIIMVTLAVFAFEIAAISKSRLLQWLIPAIVSFFMIANGTKACYLGLFAMLLGYLFFMLINRLLNKEKLRPVFLLALILLTVLSVVVYPITPRAKVDAAQSNTISESQRIFEAKLREMGYSIEEMSLEEKMADPVLKDLFFDYYQSMLGVMPDLYDRFGMDRVFVKYNMTTSAATLIDVRLMKTTYASMIWEDSDSLTRLVGYEASETTKNGMYDMENDYPALFYYYGYLGFGLFCLFILYFFYIIIRRLIKDFKGSLTTENFCLLLCLMLQLGLAQFSGALLRRPNVSVYLAVLLALIYYNTRRLPVGAGEEKV